MYEDGRGVKENRSSESGKPLPTLDSPHLYARNTNYILIELCSFGTFLQAV
jgi:hypothetical protein